MLCLSTASISQAQVAIKGLAIDMSIDDALTVVNERLSDALGQKYEIGAPTPSLFGEAPRGFGLNPLAGSSKQDLTEEDKMMRGLQGLAALGAMGGAPSAFIVQADETRKVSKIVLPGYLTDKLFNTADMRAADFAKEILNNYKIPELSPFSIDIGNSSMSGWEYSSPEGFRIRVFEDKSIEMIQIPKKSTRSFD